MDTSPIIQTPTVQTPAIEAPSVSDIGTSSAISSDFETFLKMLTAQAKYQDPLEPLDSTEYASQLAQFSAVEQQVQTNDLLSAMSAQLGSSNMAQYAGWIGMDARSTAPVNFDGQPVTLFPSPANTADQAFLVVKDALGVEVQRNAIPVSSEPVDWAGVSDTGSPFAQGTYSFEVESRALGEVIDVSPIEAYSRISEARVEDNETVLILDGGIKVSASEITALRGVDGG